MSYRRLSKIQFNRTQPSQGGGCRHEANAVHDPCAGAQGLLPDKTFSLLPLSCSYHSYYDHLQVAIGLHQPMLDLAEKLADIMPDPSLDSFFFATTGAEAVENAVKIARMYTGRDNVVVLDVRHRPRARTKRRESQSSISPSPFDLECFSWPDFWHNEHDAVQERVFWWIWQSLWQHLCDSCTSVPLVSL